MRKYPGWFSRNRGDVAFWTVSFTALCVSLYPVFIAVIDETERKRKCCESISTGVCHCDDTGSCICQPGGRSCDACKHTRLPADQAKLDQVKLQEFAERVKNSP